MTVDALILCHEGAFLGLHQICWHNKSHNRYGYYASMMQAYWVKLDQYSLIEHSKYYIVGLLC